MEACLKTSAIVCSSIPFTPKDSRTLYLWTFQKVASTLSSPSSSSSFSCVSSLRFAIPAVGCGNRGSHVLCKAQTPISEVLVATESSWNSSVIESQIPVLVEFWAPWCGPCRMIAPVVDELAKEYAGRVACFKVNTDDWPGIATQYGIRSIPTVLLFKNGEKKETVIGAVPKSSLTSSIEKYL